MRRLLCVMLSVMYLAACDKAASTPDAPVSEQTTSAEDALAKAADKKTPIVGGASSIEELYRQGFNTMMSDDAKAHELLIIPAADLARLCSTPAEDYIGSADPVADRHRTCHEYFDARRALIDAEMIKALTLVKERNAPAEDASCEDNVKVHVGFSASVETEDDELGILQHYYVPGNVIEVDGRFWFQSGVRCELLAPG